MDKTRPITTQFAETNRDAGPGLEELSGSYYDIGFGHGRDNAGHMRELLLSFGVDTGANWSETSLIAPLEKYLPDLAEEMHGIAAGSGLSLREVCALSFLADLGTASSACTGVIFADGPDGPVVGKTSDCAPGPQLNWLRPRRVTPRRGLAAIIYSHVGSPNAEMGMNVSGLSIGISGLLSRATDSGGVGWQQDIRGILHSCATTEEAIAMLRRVPIRRAGYAAVVGDASGDVAIVEKVVNAIAVRRPINNIAYEANVSLCAGVLPHVDLSWGGANGRGRTALLHRLCEGGEGKAAWTDFSLDGMLDLFSTHAEPVGICQHGPELHSHFGFFMLPRKRQLWIARGYTCERNLQSLDFPANAT